MLKAENPRSRKRHAFMSKARDLDISMRTRTEITTCMYGKTEEEKELLAEKLLEIITESETEQEMIERSKKL